MSRRKKFKEYHQDQLMTIPPTLDELIAKDHPVRVVNQVIDQIDLNNLYRKYKSRGCNSYHPKMLLKVLIYSYLNNIYSSRKIEVAIKENINLMWLSGMTRPDQITITSTAFELIS